jgi:alanine or glycine:cation symporter, AGCS family
MRIAPLAGLGLALTAALPAWAQDAGEPPPTPPGVDEAINAAIAPVAEAFSNVIFFSVPVAGAELPLIVVWLIAAACFFTVYLGFINVRGFGHAVRLAKGDYADPNDAGEVSHFQALATALSGTVGLGNIAGVAVAISLGGPGATFWMILAGLIGMSSKFAECTLAVKYRNEYPDGTVSGGPMYYLKKGLAERGWGGLGRVLGAVFAVCCVFGSFGAGNMFQANQSYLQVVNMTGGEASWLADKGWLFGLVMAALVAVVIIGGIKSIARVTDKAGPGHGAALRLGGARHHRGPRRPGAGGPHGDRRRRLLARGSGRRVRRRADPGLPPGHLLERGRRRLRPDRALGRADEDAGHRRLRGAA